MSLLLLFHGASGGASVVVPTVTTDAVLRISSSQATAQGTVVSAGGGTITERGFVISTSSSPTISTGTKFIATGTLGAMEKLLTSLTAKTNYYIRAYATNSAGTGYGANIQFETAKGFIQKQYLYKIFTAGVYVATWTKEVINEPSFHISY
jgi:hypothetical protein